MKIEVKFYKMYEPGELQAPIVELEKSELLDFDYLPNYKDTVIDKNNYYYFVHDIIHDFSAKIKTQIKAYRKVGIVGFSK